MAFRAPRRESLSLGLSLTILETGGCLDPLRPGCPRLIEKAENRQGPRTLQLRPAQIAPQQPTSLNA